MGEREGLAGDVGRIDQDLMDLATGSSKGDLWRAYTLVVDNLDNYGELAGRGAFVEQDHTSKLDVTVGEKRPLVSSEPRTGRILRTYRHWDVWTSHDIVGLVRRRVGTWDLASEGCRDSDDSIAVVVERCDCGEVGSSPTFAPPAGLAASSRAPS